MRPLTTHRKYSHWNYKFAIPQKRISQRYRWTISHFSGVKTPDTNSQEWAHEIVLWWKNCAVAAQNKNAHLHDVITHNATLKVYHFLECESWRWFYIINLIHQQWRMQRTQRREFDEYKRARDALKSTVSRWPLCAATRSQHNWATACI